MHSRAPTFLISEEHFRNGICCSVLQKERRENCGVGVSLCLRWRFSRWPQVREFADWPSGSPGKGCDTRFPLSHPRRGINASLSDDKVTLQVIPERMHNRTILELFTLAALTRAVNPSFCVEIGTYDGRSDADAETGEQPHSRARLS